MIWLSYPLLLGILVGLFIALLAILSVFKQTKLRLGIGIGLFIVIILFVVFVQDNYIDDAYRQEWKFVKLVEIIMSVFLVVAGVIGYWRGNQVDKLNENKNNPDLSSQEEVSYVEDIVNDKDDGIQSKGEGNENVGADSDSPKNSEFVSDDTLKSETATSQSMNNCDGKVEKPEINYYRNEKREEEEKKVLKVIEYMLSSYPDKEKAHRKFLL